MLALRTTGEGTQVSSSAPKRQRPKATRRELRLIRASMYAILIGRDIPVATIARTFQFAESSVYEDLAILRRERAQARRDAEEH